MIDWYELNSQNPRILRNKAYFMETRAKWESIKFST
jgi:hypothetical protein